MAIMAGDNAYIEDEDDGENQPLDAETQRLEDIKEASNKLLVVNNIWNNLVTCNQCDQRIRNPHAAEPVAQLQLLITHLRGALEVDNVDAHVLSIIVFDVLNEQFRDEVKLAFPKPEDYQTILFDTESTTFNPYLVISLGSAAAKIEQEQKRLMSEPSTRDNRAARTALKAAKSTLIDNFNHLTDVYNNPILAAKFYFKYRAEQSKSESLKHDKDYQERKSNWQTVLEALANDQIASEDIINKLLLPAIKAYKTPSDLKHRYADILQSLVSVLQSEKNRQRLKRAIAFTQHLETQLCDSWSKPLPGLTHEITADFCLRGLAQQTRARNLEINKDKFLNYEKLYDDLLRFREELLLPHQEGYRGYFIIDDLGQLDKLKQTPELSSQLKLAIIYEKGYKHQKVKIGPNPHVAYRVLYTIKETWFPMLDQDVPVWLNSWLGRLLLWDLDKREDGEALLNSCINDEDPDPNALYHLARINLAKSVLLCLNPALWKSSRDLAKTYLCRAAKRGHPKAIALLLEHQLLTSTEEILQYLRLATVFGYDFYQLVNHGSKFLKLAEEADKKDLADKKIEAANNLWRLIEAGSQEANNWYLRLRSLDHFEFSLNDAARKKFTDAIEQGWAFDLESHLQPLKERLTAIYFSNVFLRTIAKVNEHVMVDIKKDWQEIYQKFHALFSQAPVELGHFDQLKLEIKEQADKKYGGRESTVSYVTLLNELLEFLETQEKLLELHQQWQLADSLQQLWSNTLLVTNREDFIDASLKGFRIQPEVRLDGGWWESLEFTEQNYKDDYSKLNLQFNLGNILPQANSVPPINQPQEHLRRLAKGTTFVELWKLIHIYLRGYSYYLNGKLTQAAPDWPKARDRLEQLLELIQNVSKDATLESLEELINELIKITKDETSVSLAISVAYRNKWPEPEEEQTVSQQILFLCKAIQACKDKISQIKEKDYQAIQQMYYSGEDLWTLTWLEKRANNKLQQLLAANPILQLQLLKYQQRAISKYPDILNDGYYQQLNGDLKGFHDLLTQIPQPENLIASLVQRVALNCSKSDGLFRKYWHKVSKLLQVNDAIGLLLQMDKASNTLLQSFLPNEAEDEPLIRLYATPFLSKNKDGSEAVIKKEMIYIGLALEEMDLQKTETLFSSIQEVLTKYRQFLPWLNTQLQGWSCDNFEDKKDNYDAIKSKLNELLGYFSVSATFSRKASERMDPALEQVYKDFLKGLIFYVDLLLHVPEKTSCLVM